jgi:hypothetical protein
MLQAQNKSSIPVYQALNQSEKVINHTQRPDLVYSRLTTIDLLLRQVKKDGIGIIFSQYHSAVTTAKKILGYEEILITSYGDLQKSIRSISCDTRIIVISTKPGATIRISDIQSIAKAITPCGQHLKWISILQQPCTSQLFKWELKYNN